MSHSVLNVPALNALPIFTLQPNSAHELLMSLFTTFSWSVVLLAVIAKTLHPVLSRLSTSISPYTLYLTAGAIMCCFWLPIPQTHLPLVGFLRSLINTPSAALLLLSGWSLMQLGNTLSSPRTQPSLATKGQVTRSSTRQYSASRDSCAPWRFTLVISAIILYPAALGLGPWDPYRYGYFPASTTVITLIGALLWLIPHRPSARPIALWLTVSALMHQLGLCESQNLWDALLDPFAVFWALAAIIRPGHQYDLNTSTTWAHTFYKN